MRKDEIFNFLSYFSSFEKCNATIFLKIKNQSLLFMLVIYAKYKENRMEIAGVSNPLNEHGKWLVASKVEDGA